MQSKSAKASLKPARKAKPGAVLTCLCLALMLLELCLYFAKYNFKKCNFKEKAATGAACRREAVLETLQI